MTTYIQAIATGFPNVKCRAFGDGSNYNSIVWESGDPIPTQATLDAYIAANPNAFLQDNILADGTPAVLYAPLGRSISLKQQTYCYSTKTIGSRNFWLDVGNVTGGSSSGFYFSTKYVITEVSFVCSNTPNSSITLKFRPSGTSNDLLSVTINAGVKNAVVSNLAGEIPSDTLLGCYLQSSNNVSNIIVNICVAKCD